MEDTSRLNRLGSMEREGGRGPVRAVCESWMKTRVGGREDIVNVRAVLLKSWRMLKADNALRERVVGEAGLVRRPFDESLSDDTMGGVVPVASPHWMPNQSQ